MERLLLNDNLLSYKTELQDELEEILSWWMKNTPDPDYGGFLGKIGHDEVSHPEAPKGAVLNARILWSFAAGYNLTEYPEYLEYAHEAYEYIRAHFVDREQGGVYWTVDFKGNPLDTKKQVYAIAFVIYALSEYYQATKFEEARDLAVELYETLEKHSFDPVRGGYFEAFNRDWTEIADLRLSDKDANEKKTMNTHLHVLEAYTNLYRIWKDEGLKKQILSLIADFTRYIIDPESNHLILFMDEKWKPKSESVSYGHDIEAAWLLLEAAEVTEEHALINKMKQYAVAMATAAEQGIGPDGGMWYERDPITNHTLKERHWWVQAEAMVGFFNAWQLSGEDRFLQQSLKTWEFVKLHILDTNQGEWVWGIREDGTIMNEEDKAGLWKCPYHNSRACIELIKRIK
ncbi:AGE family epimerase/isomerase [Arcticibacter eurypsychrophilus]|uniref:AGE family epimerase/isomerase n=1 Tax=Arcticibacter eurypsychrophilus TaxID=1434752 RepID=UPI00084D8FBE|nr:AGE family epimerase/isomerase [Arcticibacter eurypsychrophilus]